MPSINANWVSGGCDSTIRRRLGYRFAFSRVAHSTRLPPGGVLALEMDIQNRGFASPFNYRPVDVVLIRGTTGAPRRTPRAGRALVRTRLPDDQSEPTH